MGTSVFQSSISTTIPSQKSLNTFIVELHIPAVLTNQSVCQYYYYFIQKPVKHT